MSDLEFLDELEFLDHMVYLLRSLKSDIKRKNKLSKQAMECSGTPRRRQKLATDLNWQCMEVDKSKTRIARAFEKSMIDVGTEEKEYNPSGFHKYTF